jgi:chemotaxis protein histidine kinase CheA
MDDIDDMEEVINDFLVESHENLDRLDRDFVAFEADPSQKALLPAIFRAIHTIKGTCGFLGYSKLEALSHVGETLLGKMRDGTLAPTQARITALLAMVDAIRAMLHSIETTRSRGLQPRDDAARTPTRRRAGLGRTDHRDRPLQSRGGTREKRPVLPVRGQSRAPGDDADEALYAVWSAVADLERGAAAD